MTASALLAKKDTAHSRSKLQANSVDVQESSNDSRFVFKQALHLGWDLKKAAYFQNYFMNSTCLPLLFIYWIRSWTYIFGTNDSILPTKERWFEEIARQFPKDSAAIVRFLKKCFLWRMRCFLLYINDRSFLRKRLNIYFKRCKKQIAS